MAELIVIGATGVLEGAGSVTGNLRETLTGTARAQGGTLGLNGGLTGTGKLQIADGGVLDLHSHDAFGVIFLGAASVLRLEQTAAITGTIGHLLVDDVIDLACVTVTHVKQTAGVRTLTESDGTTPALHVAAALAGNHFAISGDDSGGGKLTLTAPAALSDHFFFQQLHEPVGSSEVALSPYGELDFIWAAAETVGDFRDVADASGLHQMDHISLTMPDTFGL